MDRRKFVKQSGALAAGMAGIPNFRRFPEATVEVMNPRLRVPVSFIIDDSTALVNMAHYGIPQFGAVFPDQYKQDWRKLPREIPDSFVIEFLEWCDQNGVKGKYSMVPFPASTGWLHRYIPGWTAQELKNSLNVVRDLATPNWDIHPEMISHTRVINIKTGLPYPEATPDYMENWEWSQERSADELGEYIAFALNVLKEAGFECDGVTTPGGFGHRNITNLALGTRRAVQEVYGADIAHFFRDVVTEKGKSVVPQVMHAEGLDTDNPTCSVHIIACTGDWFGGWDGLTPGDPDRFITSDLQSGRMVEVIDSGEPALFICHWPGIYYNGDKLGFNIFKTVVTRLHQKYDNLIWMKLTDIARYWAVKELGTFGVNGNEVVLDSPFPVKEFTVKASLSLRKPVMEVNGKAIRLIKASDKSSLGGNQFLEDGSAMVFCIDHPGGRLVVREG